MRTTDGATRPGRRALVLLFLAVAVLHSLSPGVQVTDSRLSVPEAYAVLHERSLALNDVPSVPEALAQTDYDVVRRNGDTLPYFPWPPMLLAVPGVALADVAGVDVASLRPSGPNRTFPIEVPTAALLVAAATVVMALVAAEQARESPGRGRYAVGVGMLFAFGTAAWSTASRALWQHTPALLCVSLAVLAALRSRRDPRYLWLLGAALAIGFTMRPTTAVALVGLTVWAAYVHRARAWRVLAAGAVVALPFVAVNVAAYGSLLPPYYAGSRIGSEAAIGFGESLLVHLISPSRGLLVYTPLFLLAPVGLWLRRRAGRLDAFDVTAAAVVGAHWLVVAGYGSTAGSSYGARFFAEVTPLLLYLCLPVVEAVAPGSSAQGAPAARGSRAAVAVLAAASVAFAASGALTRSAFCWSATPRFVDTAPERLWDWGDPQFLRPVRDLADGRSPRAIVVGSCDAR
ncbi:MAG TPA: hypothetical protein VGX28_08010 [Frankiaceae bacterium]|jgi:hypothetical protein|nr:hypothetical protein [Frankiaceae bacterium]